MFTNGKYTNLVLVLAIILSAAMFASAAAKKEDKKRSATSEQAKVLAQSALAAMGGEARLRAVSSIKIEGIGHNYAVEQSERPDGPFIVAYQQINEIRDLANRRLRRTTEMRQSQVPDWMSMTLIVSDKVAALSRGEQAFPGSIVQVQDAEQQFALAPERLFFTALEAADLRLEKDAMMQSVPQKVLKFTWQNVPVTVYLNANTNLPTAVETLSASPYEHFWSIWGDFATRTDYTFWTLEQGGIRLPHQWDTTRNNYPLGSFTVTNLKLNEAPAEDAFKISEQTRQAFAARPLMKIDDLPLGVPNRQAVELATGIVKIPGRWDVAVVKQTDGIVIIEAPISSAYSQKVIEEAKKRFPNEKIKAVVTTSDAFPHFGGVREYAAQEIPIYALDVNRPIIERVLNAKRSFYPDALEKSPRKGKFSFVTKKTVIGEGANRLELYPILTETGERMMMVYLPEHKLLYASDLVQKSRDTFFMPQYLSEIMDAASREKLTVESVFAMHLDKTAWSEVTDAVNKQMGKL